MRFLGIVFVAICATLVGCWRGTFTDQNDAVKYKNAPVDWLFSDPKNLAVITIARIVDGQQPVLHVSHDADDGGWQFLDGGSVSEEDARVVSLLSVVERDPTLRELADLPLGWDAERDGVGKPWRRHPSE